MKHKFMPWILIILGTVLVVTGVFFLLKTPVKQTPMVKEAHSGRYDLNYYRSLKKGASFDEIQKTIGQPDSDIGSGLHIYVYKQPDGTEVWLGFQDLNSLFYVKQKLTNGTTVDIIK